MSTASPEYERLLEAPTPTDAALAKELLESRGIPTFVLGPDPNALVFGASADELFRPDLFVAKGLGAKARAILDEAWGTEKLDEA